MPEYRPLEEDNHEVFAAYTSYAFQPDSGPPSFDPEDPDTERLLMGDQRGLFPTEADPADDPLTVCTHFWFDALVRGEYHSAPGLSTVATPPEHRREGYTEELLVNSLEEYRSRDDRLSILWPFKHQFYRKYGWATCSSHHTYEIELDALSFTLESLNDSGQYRQVEADEYETLDGIYDRYTADYPLSISRGEEWWRKRVFQRWDTDPFVYVWEKEGEPRAFLSYQITGDWGDRTFRIHDLAFIDHESFLAICAYAAQHESQATTVELRLPPDVDLLELTPKPEAIECERDLGAMARIVDVETTLSALRYPDVDESVTLAVEDPLVDWNTGVFELAVTDGTAACERIEEDSGAASELETADAHLDVGSLTQLVVGYRSAETLARVGQLTAGDGTLKTLDRLYPPSTPALLTGF